MSIRDLFRPVPFPTKTDTYLEIGKYRWEGVPAQIIVMVIITIPIMTGFLIGLLVGVI